MNSKSLKNTLDELVKKELSHKRYAHTQGVVEAARKLAEHYQADAEKAEIAAVFHDYAKGWPLDSLQSYVKLKQLSIDETYLESPEILHGHVAAHYAKSSGLITDCEILMAIQYHTTGRKNMRALEKIIYLADYIEENRNFPGVEELRETAYHDLDLGVLRALNHTIRYLIDKNAVIHPDTFEARNSLLREGMHRINRKEGLNGRKNQ